MTTSVNRGYMPAVDHLRAYAALLVILYHGLQIVGAQLGHGSDFVASRDWLYPRNPLIALIEEGHSGVGLFIVLSGFILSVGVVGRDISYAGFMRSRLLRIYPMMILLAVVSTSVQPVDGGALLATILPFRLAGPIVSPYTAMFWAVQVEFECYIVFPFLLAFSNRGGTRFLLRVALVPIALCLLAVAIGASSPRDLSYWTVLGRIDQFCIGMMLARLHVRGATRRIRAWHVAPTAAAVMLVLFAYNRAGGWPADGAWKVVWSPVEAAMWGAFIVTYIAAARHMPRPISALLARVGAISYSVYLLHSAVIAAVVNHKLFVVATGVAPYDALATTVLVVVPITMALATLTFVAVERPFLQLRTRYAQ